MSDLRILVVEDNQGCLLAGMDDFLQKPARLADIQRMLETWLPKEAAS